MSNQLPLNVDPSKWKMHGWNSEIVSTYTRSPECYKKIQHRFNKPNETQRLLLRKLHEPVGFWMALRKHLNEVETEFLMEILTQYSDHGTFRARRERKATAQYLRLRRECLAWNRNISVMLPWKSDEKTKRIYHGWSSKYRRIFTSLHKKKVSVSSDGI